ncbi:MAG: twin-arginine translocase subunit TatC [Megasphaera cerevisiae]|jgi:sec-independent protein translocase protein TatC|nr:twin-arginine translocase subunit TatC [Megasphaera cerevisiae]
MNDLTVPSHSASRTMTLTGHLTELRRRLIWSIVITAAGMIVSQYFIDEIMYFLTSPAGKLYFIKPAEAFFIYFKVVLTSGAIVASPFLFYEFWAFLIPAFSQKEKTVLSLLVPSSLILFISGIAFAFFIVLPKGLDFFMAFTSSTVQPMISMESYLDFVLMLVLPFGFIFNLPLILLVFAQMGLISSAGLKKKRRYVIFAAFILAAVITPTTDMVSQCFLAAPIIVLYEISRIIIQYIMQK